MWIKRRDKTLINLQNFSSVKLDCTKIVFNSVNSKDSFNIECDTVQQAEQQLSYIVDAIKMRQQILFI